VRLTATVWWDKREREGQTDGVREGYIRGTRARGRTCSPGCLLIFEATGRIIWTTYFEYDIVRDRNVETTLPR